MGEFDYDAKYSLDDVWWTLHTIQESEYVIAAVYGLILYEWAYRCVCSLLVLSLNMG